MAKVKNKKSNLADNYAKRRKQQTAKKTITPFEVHINRDKQKVLGRKLKADHGLPGIARTKAISKRKSTLLHEYKVKDKDNIFLDRRIGEKNYGMSQEDKTMARFAAERVKAHTKKNIFNLNDDEVLTHRGQSLIEVEKYDDPRSDDDSEDENNTGKLDKKFVEDAHFGGGMLSKPDSEMSRKDIIDQLIAESKKRKAERQKLREKTIDLTEKLDTEWRDLLPLMSASNKVSDKVEQKVKPDDYDIAMRQLKFEATGMPTDKLKSEEKIAEEEKIKLEKLEQDRLARMKGFSDEAEFQQKHRSADDLDNFHIEKIEEEPSDNENESNSKKGILKKSTDNSDLMNKDKNGDKSEGEINDNSKENSEENSDEDSDESDKDNEENEEESDKDNEENEENEEESEEESDLGLSDLKDSDSSEDEKEANTVNTNHSNNFEKKERILTIGTDIVINNNEKMITTRNVTECQNDLRNVDKISTENTPDVNEFEFDEVIKKKEKMIEKARQELPYTFKAPVSYEELLSLFNKQSPDFQSVIIERIIKCNHWKLSENNKDKLLNLFVFLLRYLDDCASVNSLEELVSFFQIFDRFCPHLYDLAHANPEATKSCLSDILKQKHNQFESNTKVYPGLDTIFLFKLVSILYPTSDFRHPIVTPCLVFMSQILLRCKINKKCDISRGLFICTLILEYTLLSKRWSPATINFLRGVIYISLPKPFSKVIKALPPFKTFSENSSMLVLQEDQKKKEIDLHSVKMQIEDFIESEINDEYKIRTFVTAINLLSEYQEHCNELDAAHSIFEPIFNLLKCGLIKRYPKKVKEKVKVLINNIEKLKEKEIEYLMYDKKKPKALRMYEPRIEVVHDGKRHKSMSKAKAETEKLLHKLKKETKSAIREVRRDTAFLAKVKIKQQISSDAERKRKVKEIFGDAAMQQSELKKFKKKK